MTAPVQVNTVGKTENRRGSSYRWLVNVRNYFDQPPWVATSGQRRRNLLKRRAAACCYVDESHWRRAVPFASFVRCTKNGTIYILSVEGSGPIVTKMAWSPTLSSSPHTMGLQESIVP
jgi:hypothetical protein